METSQHLCCTSFQLRKIVAISRGDANEFQIVGERAADEAAKQLDIQQEVQSESDGDMTG